MHNTKIDSLNKVNLSIQERTYLPTYIHTYTYIHKYICSNVSNTTRIYLEK